MALNEQMQQMVQQDIQDAEIRPKEEILKEQMEGLKTAGRTARDIAVESIPGVSETLAEKRVDEALQRGDTTSAIIEGAAGLMGAVPMVGDAAAQVVRKTKSPLRKLFDKLPKKEKEELPAQPDNNRLMGYHGTARERKPDEPFFDIGFARKNDQFLGEGFYFTLDPKIAEEYANLRAFRDFDVSPIQKGKDPVLTHRETGQKTTVANLQKGLDADGNRLAMGQTISRFDLSNLEKPYIVRTQSDRKKLKQNFEEIKKEGYDSVLFADFKDRSKQIMVFPEHMEKIKSDAINFNEGGVVPMKRMAEQMELFEPVERGYAEGGLMEEGGMVDEESGNEVPPGSLREEVRDDIPAQLSEGEFVFPADVVRYIGLEKLMRMRQEAKQGLAQMEAMGQMGNGDEAVMEDDLPFDMYDLDVDDEEEYNSETRNFQVGGFVSPFGQQPYQQPTQVNPQTGTYTLPGTGIAGYQMPSGGQTGYTPYGGAAPYFQPVQFTGPQFQTSLQTTNLPTFGETVGTRPGQYDELRTYVNDAGQILQIPFKDGQPIYPIPEGYRLQGEQPKAEQPVTMPVTGTATTRDIGGGDGGVGVTSPSVTGTVTGLTSTASTLSETGGFLTSDIASNANAYGGNAKFGLSNPAMRDAVKMQGAYQAATVGILGPITSMGKTFGLMDASMNDMAIAGQTGKIAALTSLGMARPGQITTDQQATYYGNMITAAHKAKEQGLDVRDALAAEMSKPEYAEALNSAANSAMQAIGYGTNAMADPASVSRAVAGYNALAAEYEEAAEATATGSGVVRDGKGNPVTSTDPVTGQKTNVMTAQARAQLNAELEAAKTARARAEAIAAAAARAKNNVERGTSTTDFALARELAAKATEAAEEKGLDYGDEFGNMPEQAAPATRSLGRSPGEMAARSGGGPDGPTGGGGGQGSAGSSGQGCFAAGTMFFMEDGSLKAVEDIKVGDTMMHGGKVRLSIIGDGSETDWYMYGTTKVTGSHAVRENGEWKYVRYSENAIPTETEELLYTVTNENHRMISEDKIVYADYDMVDEDGIEEELLEMLNEQDVVKKAA